MLWSHDLDYSLLLNTISLPPFFESHNFFTHYKMKERTKRCWQSSSKSSLVFIFASQNKTCQMVRARGPVCEGEGKNVSTSSKFISIPLRSFSCLFHPILQWLVKQNFKSVDLVNCWARTGAVSTNHFCLLQHTLASGRHIINVNVIFNKQQAGVNQSTVLLLE